MTSAIRTIETIKTEEVFSSVSISHSVLSILPYHMAVEYFSLPLGVNNRGRLEMLMAYPYYVEILQVLQMFTGMSWRTGAAGLGGNGSGCYCNEIKTDFFVRWPTRLK
jgi:hypothetical protein